MDCELLTVGTELLLGYTVETNAARAGRLLADAGIRITRRTTVGDDVKAVRDAAGAALDRTGTVIVTGGLGPTRDDLTREAIAVLFGRRLVRDAAILEGLEERFRNLGRGPMPESNARQADVPEGATVLPNRWGTAPGLWLEGERGWLAVLLPGIPVEMGGLLEAEVIPRLRQRLAATAPASAQGPAVIRSRMLRTTGISESALADRVGDPARLVGPDVTVAWQSNVESNVATYEIYWAAMQNGPFSLVSTPAISPRGNNSNYSVSFENPSTSPRGFYVKIRAVLMDGTYQDSQVMKVGGKPPTETQTPGSGNEK